MGFTRVLPAALRSNIRLDVLRSPVTVLKGKMEEFSLEGRGGSPEDALELRPADGHLGRPPSSAAGWAALPWPRSSCCAPAAQKSARGGRCRWTCSSGSPSATAT